MAAAQNNHLPVSDESTTIMLDKAAFMLTFASEALYEKPRASKECKEFVRELREYIKARNGTRKKQPQDE